MALTITQHDFTVTLKGILNAKTASYFKKYFSFIQDPYNNLTVNIDKVTEIDASAMQTLKEMYKNAVLSSKIFFIEGKRSEEIFEAFKYPKVA